MEKQEWFSADELADLGRDGVGGLPITARGCHLRARNLGWKTREVQGRGGPGGKKTEYRPSEDVLIAIWDYVGRPLQATEPQAAYGETSARIPSLQEVMTAEEQATLSEDGLDLEVLDVITTGMCEFFNSHDLWLEPEKEAKLARMLHDRWLKTPDKCTVRVVVAYLEALWRQPKSHAA